MYLFLFYHLVLGDELTLIETLDKHWFTTKNHQNIERCHLQKSCIYTWILPHYQYRYRLLSSFHCYRYCASPTLLYHFPCLNNTLLRFYDNGERIKMFAFKHLSPATKTSWLPWRWHSTCRRSGGMWCKSCFKKIKRLRSTVNDGIRRIAFSKTEKVIYGTGSAI